MQSHATNGMAQHSYRALHYALGRVGSDIGGDASRQGEWSIFVLVHTLRREAAAETEQAEKIMAEIAREDSMDDLMLWVIIMAMLAAVVIAIEKSKKGK
jgi:hypothetical protein